MVTTAEPMQRSNAEQLAKLKKWQKAWDALAVEQASEKPDPAAMKFYLTQLMGWTAVFSQHLDDWQALESSIADLYQDMMRRYGSELRRVCKQQGYEVEGEFPTFTVDGLIRVNLNKERNIASINNKKTPSLSLPIVTERIARERKRLWERQFDPRAFLRKLHLAYPNVCQKKVVSLGEYVNIRDIHEALRATDTKYTLELFAADLSRLIESGQLRDTDGNGLELAPVRDPRQAVYIYDRNAQSGRYLGLMRFKGGR